MPDINVKQGLREIRKTKEALDISSGVLQDYAVLQQTAKELKTRRAELEATLEQLNTDAGGYSNSASGLLKLEEKKRSLRGEIQDIDRELISIQKELDTSEAVFNRAGNFDKYLLFRNIRELLKSSDVKLGQIEREAGCQAGYMSRLEKGRSTTDPSVEFVVTAAKLLKVPVDLLLFGHIAELSSTEMYIISFLEKLIKDTDADKLEWVTQSAYEVENSYNHPLYTLERIPSDDEREGSFEGLVFCSHSFGVNTGIHGPCSFLKLKQDAVLYLMDISSGAETAKEIWMVNPGKKPAYLCSTTGRVEITARVEELSDAVTAYGEGPQVREDIREIIDAFMDMGADIELPPPIVDDD